MECMPDILNRYDDLIVVHIAGRVEENKLLDKYKEVLAKDDLKRVIVKGFVTNMYQYSGAADVIITRAGATAIAEFALQSKPCIVVPNPLLAGGHQLKNAKVLASKKAVRMVNEEDLKADPLVLMAPLVELLDNPKSAEQLGEKLSKLSIGDASYRLAMLLLGIARD
jgi:UDP-N-acetylglucosamine--N-acetylmuramyl-(pentapeptide) pyrophosphoryl-undecaprenol N-acetylglucosamine transferase